MLPERFGTFFGNLGSARPSLYRGRAERQLESGDLTQAAASCEQQLELTPGDTESLRVLARACLGTGQAARAVTACHAVLHGDDSDGRDLSRCLW